MIKKLKNQQNLVKNLNEKKKVFILTYWAVFYVAIFLPIKDFIVNLIKNNQKLQMFENLSEKFDIKTAVFVSIIFIIFLKFFKTIYNSFIPAGLTIVMGALALVTSLLLKKASDKLKIEAKKYFRNKIDKVIFDTYKNNHFKLDKKGVRKIEIRIALFDIATEIINMIFAFVIFILIALIQLLIINEILNIPLLCLAIAIYKFLIAQLIIVYLPDLFIDSCKIVKSYLIKIKNFVIEKIYTYIYKVYFKSVAI